jgi:hypothetical protein
MLMCKTTSGNNAKAIVIDALTFLFAGVVQRVAIPKHRSRGYTGIFVMPEFLQRVVITTTS